MRLEMLDDRIKNAIDRIHTFTIGVVEKVYLRGKNKDILRVDVKLKYKVQGKEVLLKYVPVAVFRFHDQSYMIITPKKKDIVIVGFLKEELQKLIEDKEIKEKINDIWHFKMYSAFVLTGIFTDECEKPKDLEEEEIRIRHETGNHIQFKKNGTIKIWQCITRDCKKIDEGVYNKITFDEENNIVIEHYQGSKIVLKANGEIDLYADKINVYPVVEEDVEMKVCGVVKAKEFLHIDDEECS